MIDAPTYTLDFTDERRGRRTRSARATSSEWLWSCVIRTLGELTTRLHEHQGVALGSFEGRTTILHKADYVDAFPHWVMVSSDAARGLGCLHEPNEFLWRDRIRSCQQSRQDADLGFLYFLSEECLSPALPRRASGETPLAVLEPEVGEFCLRHGLATHLSTVSKLVASHFQIVGPVSFGVDHDPEVGDSWIAVSAKVSGDRQTVRDQYRSYVREFNASVPAEVAGYLRLVYERT